MPSVPWYIPGGFVAGITFPQRRHNRYFLLQEPLFVRFLSTGLIWDHSLTRQSYDLRILFYPFKDNCISLHLAYPSCIYMLFSSQFSFMPHFHMFWASPLHKLCMAFKPLLCSLFRLYGVARLSIIYCLCIWPQLDLDVQGCLSSRFALLPLYALTVKYYRTLADTCSLPLGGNNRYC